MRKVINGKLYDTETATLIASYEYGESGDFSHVFEDLYQKKTGELFLHAGGGPLSKYQQSVGTNTTGGSELIMPESNFDAKKWVSKNCNADTYIKLFGPVEE